MGGRQFNDHGRTTTKETRTWSKKKSQKNPHQNPTPKNKKPYKSCLDSQEMKLKGLWKTIYYIHITYIERLQNIHKILDLVKEELVSSHIEYLQGNQHTNYPCRALQPVLEGSLIWSTKPKGSSSVTQTQTGTLLVDKPQRTSAYSVNIAQSPSGSSLKRMS